MNKKLIALAVAGACVAPAAMAQTANPVTLYGRVYATFESVEAKSGASPVVRRERVSDQSSLLGVRGKEDLGGGLNAFFQLETAFKPDENNTTFAARNSGVGLEGAWGSIMMGRWDSPFKTTTIAIDPFGDLTISGLTGVMNDQTNFDRREQNVVQYWSPSFAGIAIRLMGTANENRTATTNPRDYGASVTYTRGPLYLVYAYEEHKDPSATVTKEDGNALGGTFKIGPVKLGALYEEFKKGGGRNKEKSWMGNVVWSIGKNDLIYQYMKSKDGAVSTAATQPDCDSNSIGWQYNFTKRTFIIAQYTKVDNNEAASCNFGANRLTIANGQDPQGVSFGIRHVF
jgi:predicted porin